MLVTHYIIACLFSFFLRPTAVVKDGCGGSVVATVIRPGIVSNTHAETPSKLGLGTSRDIPVDPTNARKADDKQQHPLSPFSAIQMLARNPTDIIVGICILGLGLLCITALICGTVFAIHVAREGRRARREAAKDRDADRKSSFGKLSLEESLDALLPDAGGLNPGTHANTNPEDTDASSSSGGGRNKSRPSGAV